MENTEKCGIKIEVTEDGNIYGTYTLPANPPIRNWGCICHPERKFRRPHFTCLAFCRFKRLADGKMPARIRLQPYTCFIWADRPGQWWKGPLLHLVTTIQEWLAN